MWLSWNSALALVRGTMEGKGVRLMLPSSTFLQQRSRRSPFLGIGSLLVLCRWLMMAGAAGQAWPV